MIVVMEQGSTEEQLQQVIDKLISLDFTVHRSTGVIHTVLGGVGPREVDPEEFLVMPGVRECHRVVAPYKLASRPFRPEGTVVRFGAVEIGGQAITLMAGPCCVESEAQIRASARIAAEAGAKFLRASAFRPRTSPYSFQGLGEQGLRSCAPPPMNTNCSSSANRRPYPNRHHGEVRGPAPGRRP